MIITILIVLGVLVFIGYGMAKTDTSCGGCDVDTTTYDTRNTEESISAPMPYWEREQQPKGSCYNP